MPIRNVVEIAGLGEIAPVPGARPEILGVRNLRGQILPVIDLAALLGLTPAAAPRQLLVAETGNLSAGLAIDEVINVQELPDPTEPAESEFLLGTMIHQGELLGVIDVPRLFGSLQRPGGEGPGDE
jgi:chemotaxis signal transduction protein